MRPSLVVCATLISFYSFSQSSHDELASVVEAELKREMSEFSKVNQRPYYLSYRIEDVQSARLSSSFGSLTGSYIDHSRFLSTDCRVGSYEFDNTHQGEADHFEFEDMPATNSELPLDNRPEAIQLTLWQQTQKAYRSALTAYKAVSGDTEKKETANVHDFSKEQAEVYIDEPLPDFNSFYNKAEWETRIKKYSAPFLLNSDIVDAEASLQVSAERKYFISSEGSKVVQNRTFAYLNISASVLADDGDVLPLNLSYFAYDPKDLPGDEIILDDVKKLITKLEALRKAPVAEPYTGPAILHARAAGVFFHEIFGHRIEGHRLKSKSDGQTFKARVNDLVLPKNLSVVSDPTVKAFQGQALNGHYIYDDEGVKGKPVTVVKNGVLQNFLMSRIPIDNFTSSNGHGRAQPGMGSVSRQSNLIVETTKPQQMNDLRKMLISECKKQKKPYGYLFMDVMGGFTTTQRFMPNAFNIFPIEVYRIYVDGRADELVRGVDLIGTPLAMFAEIIAADNKPEVFTGFCGAESGSVPVTAISPSLFVKRIETQKKMQTQIEKNLLKRPVNEGSSVSKD